MGEAVAVAERWRWMRWGGRLEGGEGEECCGGVGGDNEGGGGEGDGADGGGGGEGATRAVVVRVGGEGEEERWRWLRRCGGQRWRRRCAWAAILIKSKTRERVPAPRLAISWHRCGITHNLSGERDCPAESAHDAAATARDEADRIMMSSRILGEMSDGAVHGMDGTPREGPPCSRSSACNRRVICE